LYTQASLKNIMLIISFINENGSKCDVEILWDIFEDISCVKNVYILTGCLKHICRYPWKKLYTRNDSGKIFFGEGENQVNPDLPTRFLKVKNFVICDTAKTLMRVDCFILLATWWSLTSDLSDNKQPSTYFK